MSGILEIKRKGAEHPPAQRDISAIYKAVQAYHIRHDPPQDTPGYWEWAIPDIQAVSNQYNNSPLIKDLLAAALSDLEREYKRLLAEQGGT
ncbi:MAG: hypothetical protein BWY65_02224 [Firmicutes bacterium ADurb.Bin373]|nr:MAG: hypothetical protein BWY65_02224 [Firmicutes bacterium ADurb.Bin373]